MQAMGKIGDLQLQGIVYRSLGLCIIMLKNELMVVDEWHNNGPPR
jgi:hypothetical protein